ncbi:hypothetical protein [Arcticibacter svalbardensis]|uniref:hypothetical protein n=1 Tax=Arcticibacter svalbardensis TaxID=1288027 RepID=UPI000689DE8C|nr:hypothetical protein [Arcticibacter svalbardensis]
MNTVADAFGEEERARFAADIIVIGVVILVYVADTKPPKEKRLIVVGESYDHVSVATVYINTELNTNVFPTKELQSLNPEFTSDGRVYLKHKSHVDCSSLHVLRKEFLVSIISADPNRALGNVSEDDFKIIRGLIKSARTIKPSLKKTYGLFL